MIDRVEYLTLKARVDEELENIKRLETEGHKGTVLLCCSKPSANLATTVKRPEGMAAGEVKIGFTFMVN